MKEWPSRMYQSSHNERADVYSALWQCSRNPHHELGSSQQFFQETPLWGFAITREFSMRATLYPQHLGQLRWRRVGTKEICVEWTSYMRTLRFCAFQWHTYCHTAGKLCSQDFNVRLAGANHALPHSTLTPHNFLFPRNFLVVSGSWGFRGDYHNTQRPEWGS